MFFKVNSKNFNSVFPGEPEELLISGKFNKDVDIIIGTNDNEGILDMMSYLPKALNPDPTLWDQLRNNFETLGPGYLFNIANQSEITSEDVEKMHEIVSFYVGSIDNINEEHMDAMIDMFTDAGISRLHYSSPLVISIGSKRYCLFYLRYLFI